MALESARQTSELRLRAPTSRVYGATPQASRARVRWIDRHERHTDKRSLVGDVRPQLVKRPSGMLRSLTLVNRYPLADALEFLKGYAASGAFGLLHESFADPMVLDCAKTCFLSCDSFEFAFGTLRALRLKSLTVQVVALPDGFNSVPGMELTVRVNRKVLDAKVATEPSGELRLQFVRHLNGHKEVELAFPQYEVRFASVVGQERPLALSADEGDSGTSTKNPYAYCFPDPCKQSRIVRDRAQRSKGSLDLVVKLVGIRNLGIAAHDHLRAKVGELISGFLVRELVKLVLLECLKFPRSAGQPATSLIRSTDRRRKQRGLLLRRKELYLYRQFHNNGSRMTSSVEVNPPWIQKGSANPRPEGRGLTPRLK